MKNDTRRIKAELWEIQAILYWMLSLGLFHDHHPILGWVTLIWGVITVIGAMLLHAKARKESL